MTYRNLGRTGAEVSAFCLGCAPFGQAIADTVAYDLVDRALDLGINFLDTANAYGRSEEVLGEALARSGRRDEIILATKVGSYNSDTPPNGRGTSRRHIIEQCDRSLRRLQTDRIDLYQIHLPFPHIPLDETLRALDDLVRAGKVRYIGGSNYAAWQYVEALWIAKELGLNRFISEQMPYHLLDRTAEVELVPMAQTYGLALNVYSPLAEGLLSGKYRRGAAPPADSRFAGHGGVIATRLTDEVVAVLGLVETLAGEKGCTMTQLALAWCAGQPGVTATIIGPKTLEQLADNAAAGEFVLTEDDRVRLDALAPPRRALVPYRDHYARLWGPHPSRG
jgi:aryl-alcohol dehydrogenase-like predicted oxidoreductase